MANAAQKRTAVQNERAIRDLKLGSAISVALAVLLRLLFRRSLLPASTVTTVVIVLTSISEVFILRYLFDIGTVKRDETNTLISAGEDLSQGGITAWCFDIVYITWFCQVGSAILGDKFWLVYLIIPLFAFYKLWTSFISPILLGRSSAPEEGEGAPTESKRQQKLRQRSGKGDPRVRAVQSKRN